MAARFNLNHKNDLEDMQDLGYQCTQRVWADSFGSHDNYKGESTDSVISLL